MGLWALVLSLMILNAIAAGAILWRAKRVRVARPAAPQVNPEEVYGLLRRLGELAAATNHEVIQHSSRMQAVSNELSSAVDSDEKTLRSVLMATSERLLRANEQLLGQLTSTKAKLKEHEQQIEVYMAEARTDGLVGIANRRAFDEELARHHAASQRQGVPLSVILVDLDHFKKVNDQYGHQAGDEVLQGVGRVLADNLRQMDFAARYGGEEFAVILPGTRLNEAKAAVERFRAAIAAAEVVFMGTQIKVTASFGLAELRSGETAACLLQHADLAVYAAKENGRNRGYFYNGTSCEPIRLETTETTAEVAAVVRQHLEEYNQVVSSERRSCPRRPFRKSQRVAPYTYGRFPPLEEFHEVECRDLTSRGFSFWFRKPPKAKFLVVGLGAGTEWNYLLARVAHVTELDHEGTATYLVGCQFVRRLHLDTAACISVDTHTAT